MSNLPPVNNSTVKSRLTYPQSTTAPLGQPPTSPVVDSRHSHMSPWRWSPAATTVNHSSTLTLPAVPSRHLHETSPQNVFSWHQCLMEYVHYDVSERDLHKTVTRSLSVSSDTSIEDWGEYRSEELCVGVCVCMRACFIIFVISGCSLSSTNCLYWGWFPMDCPHSFMQRPVDPSVRRVVGWVKTWRTKTVFKNHKYCQLCLENGCLPYFRSKNTSQLTCMYISLHPCVHIKNVWLANFVSCINPWSVVIVIVMSMCSGCNCHRGGVSFYGWPLSPGVCFL